MKTRLKPGNETLCHARGLLYVRLESVDDKTFPSPEVRKSVFPGRFLCVWSRSGKLRQEVSRPGNYAPYNFFNSPNEDARQNLLGKPECSDFL